ncbi:hypothetical protein QCA50_011939 [Cerrena zonata]|uniref:Dihydroorotate dehydrogenase (quinone), mitochondrial n=1 Tax=Cerrena zonata TaxID=2478898 RepID=A0AAW0FY45_9APHY
MLRTHVSRRLLSQLSPRAPQRFASTSASSHSSPLRTGLYASVFAISTGLFAVYYFDSRSAIHRYVFTPAIRYALDPEAGHKFALKVLASGLAPRDTQEDDEILKAHLWDQQLSNPIGLAAGFDKDGEAVDGKSRFILFPHNSLKVKHMFHTGLFNLGFSWVEIGSVTPKPQPGNPKPRVFHLPTDHALINRYGFPSDGHTAVISRLRGRISTLFQEAFDQGVGPASLREGKLLAVNLGKNKSSPPDAVADFVEGVKKFAGLADVLVVNVSSPNTPGLRGLQTRTLLQGLLDEVTKARDETVALLGSTRIPKLILKVAPDLTESDALDIAEAVRTSTVDGIIVSNTTIQRPAELSDPNKNEVGGLSGPPLKALTLVTLKTLRANLPASIPIIGCGGISTGRDALDYAQAGASYVQLYTEFGYDGVGAIRRIKDELSEELKKLGMTWQDVVRESVQRTSLQEKVEAIPALKSEATVQLLIQEAEELKKLLDAFADKTADSSDNVARTVQTNAA